MTPCDNELAHLMREMRTYVLFTWLFVTTHDIWQSSLYLLSFKRLCKMRRRTNADKDVMWQTRAETSECVSIFNRIECTTLHPWMPHHVTISIYAAPWHPTLTSWCHTQTWRLRVPTSRVASTTPPSTSWASWWSAWWASFSTGWSSWGSGATRGWERPSTYSWCGYQHRPLCNPPWELWRRYSSLVSSPPLHHHPRQGGNKHWKRTRGKTHSPRRGELRIDNCILTYRNYRDI